MPSSDETRGDSNKLTSTQSGSVTGMALTPKGSKIMRAMRKRYGPRAENVFYGAACKGTIKGVTTRPVCNRRPSRRARM